MTARFALCSPDAAADARGAGLWRALWTRRYGALWDSPLVATSWPRRAAPATFAFSPDLYYRFALAWCEWAVAGLSLIHISEPTRPY